VSLLEERLRAGERVVSVELPARVAASPEPVVAALAGLAGRVDAVSVTDNAGAHAHASALAVSALVRANGMEPIMNLACRDRNRLALQAELLGAALHGIRNVVCVTGDDVSQGDEPEARRVFDLDSPQLLSVARALEDGAFLSGRAAQPPPRFFLGAVENPAAGPALRAERALKKALAGASFFQLQVVFEPDPVAEFLGRARQLGVSERAFVLPSVCILRSARQLRYMREHISGIVVPDAVLAAVEALPPAEQARHCFELAVSLARTLLDLPDVSGIHLIPLGGVELTLELLDRLAMVSPN